jgi:hypothetical protein
MPLATDMTASGPNAPSVFHAMVVRQLGLSKTLINSDEHWDWQVFHAQS